MPYDAKAIANYFLDLADARAEPLSPLKIQKLVYFANGWHLALRNAPIIDEQVEAWPYGPVIPSLYRAFRKYGDQPITARAERVVTEFHGTWKMSFRRFTPSIDEQPGGRVEFTKNFLKRIWDTFGGYTAIQLSNLTHQEGTPWHRVFVENNGNIPKGTDIPQSLMKEYFLKQSKAPF
jgi:uncharacterized phage-associated protein